MELSTMRRFYDTVDEEQKSPILDQISSRWDDVEEASIFRASANFVAKVETGHGTCFLRFNHETERSVFHILNELKYIERLISEGIHANKPKTSSSGKLVESVETELGVFNAVMFEEVPGEHIESDSLDLSGFRRWGEALAMIHNASHGIELEGAPTWETHLDMLYGVPSNLVLEKEAGSVRDSLSSLSRSNFGVIVFDFEMDNVKWDGDSLGFMDFDDYCVHWYAADVAYALRDLFNDKISGFNPAEDRFIAFIDGYRSVRPISDEELRLIPVFIRLHNLYFYARIHRAIGEPEQDEPEWVVNLRKRLQGFIDGYLEDMRSNPIL